MGWQPIAFFLAGCSGTVADQDSEGPTLKDSGITVEVIESPGCPHPPDLYDPGCVVRYDISIAEDDWQAMQDDYDCAVSGCGNTSTLKDKRPAVLTYGVESLDVGIRLKGNASTFLAGGKMQFRIDINWLDPDAEFHGVTSVNLEAANYDPTGQKNGLALEVFRDAGLVASRANFATLYVNDEFYAVYENVEQINGQFLDNHYEDSTGNLYYFIWNGHYSELRSNEEIGDVSNWTAMEDLVNNTPGSISMEDFHDQIVRLVDVDELLLAFAAEAVIPQVDGVWAGSANCYVYDVPLA